MWLFCVRSFAGQPAALPTCAGGVACFAGYLRGLFCCSLLAPAPRVFLLFLSNTETDDSLFSVSSAPWAVLSVPKLEE